VSKLGASGVFFLVFSMLNTILGSKIKMEQTFVEDTRVVVTLVKSGPCVVTQIKNEEKDGYWAVQLGFGSKRIKNVTKQLQGHLRGVIKDKTAPRFLREIRLDKKPDVSPGDVIRVSDILKEGDLVSVTGTSKGKGFAGVIKRWGFAGGPRTHGQSDRQRAPGSIGQGTTPGRVHKGKKMPGRMGSEQVTIKNLIVVSVDKDRNQVSLSGPVPGNACGLLIIKKVGEGKLSELVEEAPQVQVQPQEQEESKDESPAAKEQEKEETKNG
jgi:large subunit ribosomal protein L3